MSKYKKELEQHLSKMKAIDVQKMFNRLDNEQTEQFLRKEEIQYVAKAVLEKVETPELNRSFYFDELNKNKEKLRQKSLTIGDKTIIIMKNKYLSFVINNYDYIF